MSTMTPKSMFFYFVDWMYDVIWCRIIFHCSFLYVIVLKVSISFANKNVSEFLSSGKSFIYNTNSSGPKTEP